MVGDTRRPVELNDSSLFDNAPWDEMVSKVAELQGNSEAGQHLVYRFLGQYLPALLSARTQEASERVWFALWSYLTTPATKAKPFALSSSSADDLIVEIQRELSRRGYHPQA
jgi:hypothetical protein